MAEYIAITIGPIIETMNLTATPGGLWCASYMFSWVAREIIKELLKKGVKGDDFISPAFDTKDGEIVLPDCAAKGVGMFHDRIIFESNEHTPALPAVNEIINSIVNGELAERIFGSNPTNGNRRKWLRQYLRIYAASKDIPAGCGPITIMGDLMSAMELEPSFASGEEDNPLLNLFENTSGSGYNNTNLKESKFVKDLKENEWMLLDGHGNVRNIESIAARGKDITKTTWKNECYYAILNSDGDNIGKLFASLSEKKDIRDASKHAMSFCGAGAEIILNYGGIPIYAGGDDLLAILPLYGNGENGEPECSVFTLVKELDKIFNEKFEAERASREEKPSISIGISIQFYKSPLYEALNQTYQLLYNAKQEKGKNALCMKLIKHSGQEVNFTVNKLTDSESMVKLDGLIKTIRAASTSKEDNAVFLNSVGFKIEDNRKLFIKCLTMCSAADQGYVENIFANLFDAEDQKKYSEWIEKIKELLIVTIQEVINNRAAALNTITEHEAENVINKMTNYLRMVKFMVEPGKEEE